MAHIPDPTLRALTPHQLQLVTLFGEVRGEPVQGQIAVCQVFHHRLQDGRWGDSIEEVLLAWAQFSCLWPTLGGGNFKSVLELATRLVTGEELKAGVEQQLDWVVSGVAKGLLRDVVAGATHYYANTIPPPFWVTKDTTFCGQFGRHLFYRNVS
jgi:N-acetylmuramoyl-L-alanine amidase